ncbi:MAG: HAD-IIB family hydrolase [Lactobacillaceae bacterium]|jgi:Cof subfamily protein (haloacid dehalogenase superfamily)|nr:HAD-IIB family hydrolase [Lactobacillaceae bacterium]
MTIPKLFASDVDGTFNNASHDYDAVYFAKVLEEINQRGSHFIIASGRDSRRIAQTFKPFIGKIDIVSNNGAYVKTADGEVIGTFPMDPAVVVAAHEIIEAIPTKLKRTTVFTGITKHYMFRHEALVNWQHTVWLLSLSKLVLIKDFTDIDEPIVKITFSMDEHQTTTFIQQARAELDGKAHVTTSGYGSIDIVAPDVNKAHGIQLIADYYGLEAADLAAFGDGINDIEMLDLAGRPFAMPNGHMALIEAYPAACADNNNNGVLKTIEQLLQDNLQDTKTAN